MALTLERSESSGRSAVRVLTWGGIASGVPEAPLPSAGKPNAPPPAPKAAVLGDAKITIDAPAFRVFAALTDADQLAAWWGDDVVVEADEGGRYEATIDEGRIEGTITAIDGPQTLTFTWPVPVGDVDVTTSVHYDLSPQGPHTAVHIAHRAPKEVPGNWSALWQGILDALKAYVEETEAGGTPQADA
jgi:uncharacterized protein YndB with AHSA1/START domain